LFKCAGPYTKILQVLKQGIGSKRTNESNEIYKGSLCCKSESEDSSEADYHNLTSSESEVKNLKLVKVSYLKTQVCRRNRSLEQRLFQRN